jgi:soluble lytic murein transglycosylase-like protein
MEKRLKKTLARTFGCGKGCAKLALALALFAPALTAFQLLPQELTGTGSRSIVKTVEIRERIRSKELVRIYSIVRSHRPDVAESEIWKLSEVIHEESSKRRLDPLLVLAVIRVESGFRSAAVSPVGARGIMQIMPDTGKFLAEALAGEYGFRPAAFKPESLDDPVLNLRLGIYYLHDLQKQFRQLNVALTAYNFGPGDTQSRLENNIELSDEFAALVLDAYQRYKRNKHPVF